MRLDLIDKIRIRKQPRQDRWWIYAGDFWIGTIERRLYCPYEVEIVNGRRRVTWDRSVIYPKYPLRWRIHVLQENLELPVTTIYDKVGMVYWPTNPPMWRLPLAEDIQFEILERLQNPIQ